MTKYRRKVITEPMMDCMAEVFQRVCKSNRSTMIEVNGAPDHVHLLIDLHPDNNISKLVASLKGASSRIVRQRFAQELSAVYRKPVFWSGSYYVSSTGGAPLSRVKQYIDGQAGFESSLSLR